MKLDLNEEWFIVFRRFRRRKDCCNSFSTGKKGGKCFRIRGFLLIDRNIPIFQYQRLYGLWRKMVVLRFSESLLTVGFEVFDDVWGKGRLEDHGISGDGVGCFQSMCVQGLPGHLPVGWSDFPSIQCVTEDWVVDRR